MKKRELLSRRQVGERSTETKMTITSKCPDKWLFVDLETGEVWHTVRNAKEGKYPFWRGANEVEKKELKRVAHRQTEPLFSFLNRDRKKLNRALSKAEAAMEKGRT
jgi:hypothetical protein